MSHLAQDVTLLLLNDKSGHSVVDLGRRYRAVGCALLLDLTRAGRITIETPEDKPKAARPVVRDSTPTGDPALDKAVAILEAKEMKLGWAAENVGHECWRPLLDTLVERGLLRHEKGRFLGVIPTHAWPSADEAHETEVLRRVRGAVVEGQRPDESTVLLLMILHSVGALAAILPGEDKKAVEAEAARIVREVPAGEPWGEAFKGLDTALFAVLLGAS
jgi:hypothetical protein